MYVSFIMFVAMRRHGTLALIIHNHPNRCLPHAMACARALSRYNLSGIESNNLLIHASPAPYLRVVCTYDCVT